MKAGTKHFTPELLADIYKLNASGATIPEIIREIKARHGRKITRTSVYQSVNRLNVYLTQFNSIHGHKKAYVGARNIIRKGVVVSSPIRPVKAPTITPVKSDPFATFEAAMETFQNEVKNFTERVVQIKYESMQKELEDLRRVQEAAKSSNLVSSLRRHFMGV